MTQLSSSDLAERVTEAGITYNPADKIFYEHYPYRVELSPKFKGVSTPSKVRVCKIDPSNPAEARLALAAYVEDIEKLIENVEHRQEICDFVTTLPDAEYKMRVGGENSLFYFKTPETVMVVIEKYKDIINTVSGPLNDDHKNALVIPNTAVRPALYFGEFRYYIEFNCGPDFNASIAPQLTAALRLLDNATWRDNGLISLSLEYTPPPSPSSIGWARGRLSRNKTRKSRTVKLYLSNKDDYVYMKMIGAQYVRENHAVILIDELR